MRRRGLSLISVLGLVTLLATVAGAMVAMFTCDLNLLQGSNNGQVALDEAEAGLNQVLLNLACDPSYGTHGEAVRRTLNPGFSPAQCYHEVTFDPAAPRHSSNASAGAMTGYGGRPVPADSVHVISTGYCRGQVRTLEGIIRQPPFNFALASAGPIRSANPVRIEGIDSRQRYIQGQSRPLPGHIASNSAQGIQILDLPGVNTLISGEARSAGPISLDPNAVVMGGQRPNSGTLALPNINLQSFDPQGAPGLQQITTVTSTLSTLSSTQRCNQSTTFTNQVTFGNGLLYVAGDATFDRGLQGSGAIIVDGNLTIRGAGTQLMGTDCVAILATGKVTIEGDPSQSVTQSNNVNFVNGLVYGAQGVDLSNITVAGIVLTQDSNSNTQLNNTNLMYVADAAQLQVQIAPVVSSGGSDLPPIFDLGGGRISIGLPQGANFGDYPQVSPPPGQSLQDMVRNVLTTNPANINVGRLMGPGFDSTLGGPPQANQVDDWARRGTTPAPSDPQFTQVLGALLDGTHATQTGWTVTNPGATFRLDLNNFLPRSATLRVTGLYLHHRRL